MLQKEIFFDKYGAPTVLSTVLAGIVIIVLSGWACWALFIDKDDVVGYVSDKYWVAEVRIEQYVGTTIEVPKGQIPLDANDCTCFVKSFSVYNDNGWKIKYDDYCTCTVYRWQLVRVLRKVDSGQERWPEYELGEWERVKHQSKKYFIEIKYENKIVECLLNDRDEWAAYRVEQEVVSKGSWTGWEACEVK